MLRIDIKTVIANLSWSLLYLLLTLASGITWDDNLKSGLVVMNVVILRLSVGRGSFPSKSIKIFVSVTSIKSLLTSKGKPQSNQ